MRETIREWKAYVEPIYMMVPILDSDWELANMGCC